MPARFPTPAELNEAQAKLKVMAEKVAPEGVEYERDGALQGPFSPFFYTPSLIDWYWSGAYQGIQQPPLQEHPRDIKIVIHAVLSTYDPPHPFIKYAHGKSSLDLGFTQSQLDTMLVGKVPEDLSEQERTLYEFSLELAKSRGPISDELFWRADKIIGKERVAANIHMVTGYIQASLLSYVADSSAVVQQRK